MKIALYIEDGLEQLVLTPQSKHETNLLGLLANGSRELSIVQGQFFECMGGFVRHTNTPTSTMIVLRPAKADRSPEGQDAERLDRNDESAVGDSRFVHKWRSA